MSAEELKISSLRQLNESLEAARRMRRVGNCRPVNTKNRVPSSKSGASLNTTSADVRAYSNVVHQRKLINTFEDIDKQKRAVANRHDDEARQWKLKHDEFLHNRVKQRDLQETFFNSAGFRYHRNGEMRKSKNCLNEEKSMECRVTVKDIYDRSHTKTPSIFEMDFSQEIADTEQAIKAIKKDSELKLINRNIDNVKSTLTFLRAHARDSYPQPNFETCPTGRSPKRVLSSKSPNRSAYKIHCSACNGRMREDLQDAVKKAKCKRNPADHNKRWLNAPSGYLVPSLERPASTILARPMVGVKDETPNGELICKSTPVIQTKQVTDGMRKTKSSMPATIHTSYAHSRSGTGLSSAEQRSKFYGATSSSYSKSSLSIRKNGKAAGLYQPDQKLLAPSADIAGEIDCIQLSDEEGDDNVEDCKLEQIRHWYHTQDSDLHTSGQGTPTAPDHAATRSKLVRIDTQAKLEEARQESSALKRLSKVQLLQDIEIENKEALASRKASFLGSLPPEKASIVRWRSSAGVQKKLGEVSSQPTAELTPSSDDIFDGLFSKLNISDDAEEDANTTQDELSEYEQLSGKRDSEIGTTSWQDLL